jgi:hypothetical protein
VHWQSKSLTRTWGKIAGDNAIGIASAACAKSSGIPLFFFNEVAEKEIKPRFQE